MAHTTMDLKPLSKEEMHENWINVTAYAKRTGWTKEAIYKWIKVGKIEARLFHNLILVRNIEHPQLELPL